MIEAIFFVGFVVLITSILVGILNYIDRKELNYEINLLDCGGARDHFDHDGHVWHYNGTICSRVK